MKTPTHKALACLIALTVAMMAAFLTGCDIDDNAVSGFLYQEVGGEYVVTDQFDNSIVFTRDQARQIADLGEAPAAEFLAARFRNTFPVSYQDPSTQMEVVAAEDIQGDIVPSSQASSIANGIGAIPSFGPLASLIANGLLGIGALWYRHSKKKSEKVSESLVLGIDVFRDVLDQTPQGEKIDARLTEVLKDRQNELGVAREVGKLLTRYATPTKKPIEL